MTVNAKYFLTFSFEILSTAFRHGPTSSICSFLTYSYDSELQFKQYTFFLDTKKDLSICIFITIMIYAFRSKFNFQIQRSNIHILSTKHLPLCRPDLALNVPRGFACLSKIFEETFSKFCIFFWEYFFVRIKSLYDNLYEVNS